MSAWAWPLCYHLWCGEYAVLMGKVSFAFMKLRFSSARPILLRVFVIKGWILSNAFVHLVIGWCSFYLVFCLCGRSFIDLYELWNFLRVLFIYFVTYVVVTKTLQCCGSQDLSSGYHDGQQAPLLPEPAHRSLFAYIKTFLHSKEENLTWSCEVVFYYMVGLDLPSFFKSFFLFPSRHDFMWPMLAVNLLCSSFCVALNSWSPASASQGLVWQACSTMHSWFISILLRISASVFIRDIALWLSFQEKPLPDFGQDNAEETPLPHTHYLHSQHPRWRISLRAHQWTNR